MDFVVNSRDFRNKKSSFIRQSLKKVARIYTAVDLKLDELERTFEFGAKIRHRMDGRSIVRPLPYKLKGYYEVEEIEGDQFNLLVKIFMGERKDE